MAAQSKILPRKKCLFLQNCQQKDLVLLRILSTFYYIWMIDKDLHWRFIIFGEDGEIVFKKPPVICLSYCEYCCPSWTTQSLVREGKGWPAVNVWIDQVMLLLLWPRSSDRCTGLMNNAWPGYRYNSSHSHLWNCLHTQRGYWIWIFLSILHVRPYAFSTVVLFHYTWARI